MTVNLSDRQRLVRSAITQPERFFMLPDSLVVEFGWNKSAVIVRMTYLINTYGQTMPDGRRGMFFQWSKVHREHFSMMSETTLKNMMRQLRDEDDIFYYQEGWDSSGQYGNYLYLVDGIIPDARLVEKNEQGDGGQNLTPYRVKNKPPTESEFDPPKGVKNKPPLYTKQSKRKTLPRRNLSGYDPGAGSDWQEMQSETSVVPALPIMKYMHEKMYLAASCPTKGKYIEKLKNVYIDAKESGYGLTVNMNQLYVDGDRQFIKWLDKRLQQALDRKSTFKGYSHFVNFICQSGEDSYAEAVRLEKEIKGSSDIELDIDWLDND